MAGDGGYVGAGASSAPPPSSVPLAADTSESTKFFTITATLREEYDDNIFTAKTGKVSSLETDFSPSILFDLPMEDSDFSARYTFDMTYYNNRQGDSFDLTHEFIAQYRHSFSDRFGLNLAEQFRYYTEPSLFESIGTLYRNGAYISNTVNGAFNAQWTPLFGTVTTYSNTIVRYEDAATAQTQDSMENTASQSFSFAVLPKVNYIFGAIVDNITYDQVVRGYTNYTANTGLDWQALPTLTLGGRVGGSITEADQSGSSVSPYGAVTLGWQLGARSSLTFNYAHDVVPTDVSVAEGQVADRFTSNFKYDITPDITAHLEGILTHGDYTQSLILPGTVSSFTEDDYAIDTGLGYHVNSNFDVETGYIFSGVSSEASFRDYERNQVYVGLRGTY